MAQPQIVTQNLTKEIALGRVAGPFSNPPFANFQVSPIGLVPKKHSDKFRTIFHLSFPKSGTSSVNHFISKEDYSLHYITIDNAIEVSCIWTNDLSWLKQTLSRPFGSYLSGPPTTTSLACFGTTIIIMI